MKLLIEENSVPMNFITESYGDEKALYIEGPFLQADVKNKNRRIYSRDIMRNAVDKYRREKIDTNRAYGELQHPKTPEINLDRVSHLVVGLEEEGSTWYGKARITVDTPCGQIARGLLNAGANLGVSSRGLGSVQTVSGVSHVQEDFEIATAADIVADPSAPDAFVNSLMESADWIYECGMWRQDTLDEAIKRIKKTSSRKLEERKIEEFNRFLRSL